MIDRNKINFFYLLYINDIMGNGPWASGGPGQVPLLPWPRAGPALSAPHYILFIVFSQK